METEIVKTPKDRRMNPSVCREQRSTVSVAKPLGNTQGRKEPRLIQWLLSYTHTHAIDCLFKKRCTLRGGAVVDRDCAVVVCRVAA